MTPPRILGTASTAIAPSAPRFLPGSFSFVSEGPGRRKSTFCFPSGFFGKGNYAAGYSALIDDLPSSLFSTENVKQPAIFRQTGPGDRTYAVESKMRYSRSDAEKEAKS